MEAKVYPLDDNPALVQEVVSRVREGGETWESLREGIAKPAIDQLSSADEQRLKDVVLKIRC
tara:strand:- start:443 stop:628 length:186 start_codon:yes stop_codon:yes gene_type:complete